MVEYNWKKTMNMAKKEADELKNKIHKMQGVKASYVENKFTIKATTKDKLKDVLKIAKDSKMKMIKKKTVQPSWKLDYWGLDF